MKSNVVGLPHTWCDAKISEITSVNPTLDKAGIPDDLDISFVPMPAVQAESGIIDVSGIRKFSEVKKGYTPFREGDVLFAKITPCMENGKMAVVPEVRNGIGFGSTEFHVLRALSGVNAKYIYYYVSSQAFRREAEHNMSGAVGQRRVTTPYLSACEVPLPPTNEQHRIVAKIEELFSELDKGIENLKTARAQLKVYRQALLKHVFFGKGLAQKGIIAKPFGEEFFLTLGEVIQTLGQGWSPRCLETPSPSDDKWGVIRTTAIQPLNFDDTKNKQLPVGLKPRPHLEIIPGDVLITRAGPRTRVGIACFVKSTRPKLMVCDKAYRLQVDKERIIPQYLMMLLNTSEVLNELEKLKSGISDSGLNLTQEKFLTLKVMVPSLEHQQIILDDLEEKLTNVAFLETQIDDSLQQAEVLRQSILKKAFSGQLVAQDANDESASVLLARIKAEGAVQIAMAKPHKPQKAQTQPVPAKTKVIPFPVKLANISTTDLHAGILARAYQHHEYTSKYLANFGHVKAEKIVHLVEAHLGIDLEREPVKAAAGPNDFPRLINAESRAKKMNWFDVRKQEDGAYVLTKRVNFDALLLKTRNALGERADVVDALINKLLPLNRRQAEIVATLYAAWNNLLLFGRSPSDEDIVFEARENWHDSKLKIERDKFFRGIKWMREQGLVPSGKGRHVSAKEARKTVSKKKPVASVARKTKRKEK